MSKPAAVVVLAAGQGTRMRSELPKVLHRVCGRSLLGHLLAATQTLEAAETLVVVGHGRDAVAAEVAAAAPAASCVVQEEQKGTGHAVRRALAELPTLEGTVVVVPGDVPLLTGATLQRLVAEHEAAGAVATVLTARMADPTGYGRVLRDVGGGVLGIVEQRDATAEQREINEVGTSIYAFDALVLRDALGRLTTDNVQGEEYLTDVIALFVAGGRRVGAVLAGEAEVGGVNDRAQLGDAGAALRDRTVREWQRSGVTVVDRASTWIDVTVTLEPDCTVEPFTMLHGRTTVAAGATVGPYSRLTDTSVGAGASVVAATCVGAQIGAKAAVGPYTYLRAGTVLETAAKAGGFVEIKKSTVGAGSKVPHLSYIGDATIGANVNIGAGSITCNFDGRDKHQTYIGDDVFIGSDTMLVAPVTVGDGAYTAAGSAITRDVPAGSLAVGRAQQRTIDGWAERRGRRTVHSASPPETVSTQDPDSSTDRGAQQ
ncbi:MAG: bifunctional UDP-N-acetylglucosamine diphosphorylase/glucosamine-1-phosphate N-acetyltransferase GlmU [Actinomycetota bacterium]